MASTSDLGSAQCPPKTICPFCNSSRLVNWFCNDCDDFLCDDCMKEHVNVQTSRNHRVIYIGESSSPQTDHERHRPRQKPVPCEDHRKACCNYCVKCHKLVCPECLVNKHKKHDLAVIDSVYEYKMKILERFEIAIEENLIPAISRNIEYLESTNEWYDQKLEIEKEKIHEQDKKFKQKITDFTNKLLGELMEDFEKNKCDVSKEKERLEKTLKELNEKLSSFKELKNEESLQDFLHKYPKNVNTYVKECNTSIICTSMWKVKTFHFGEVIENSVSKMFGSLKTLTSEPNINLELVESIPLGMKFDLRSSLAVEENGTIWIGTKNGLMKKESNKKIEKINGVDENIVDIACTKSGELFFVKEDVNALMKVLYNDDKVQTVCTFSEQITTFLSTSLSVVSINVASDGRIFLFCKRQLHPLLKFIEFYSLESFFKLLVISSKGKLIKNITIPVYFDDTICNVRIAENVNGHFCILCSRLNEYKYEYYNEVIDIDSKGQYCWSYKKHPGYSASDIMTTNLGSVIVSFDNHLQIFNREGKYLNEIRIKESPVSLCFRKDRKLACLCHGGTVHIFQITHNYM